MIDFESSSTKRRVSNVTSITQAIFIGSGIAKKVQRIYKIPSKEKIIEVLRIYKQEQSRDSFENLLKILNVVYTAEYEKCNDKESSSKLW